MYFENNHLRLRRGAKKAFKVQQVRISAALQALPSSYGLFSDGGSGSGPKLILPDNSPATDSAAHDGGKAGLGSLLKTASPHEAHAASPPSPPVRYASSEPIHAEKLAVVIETHMTKNLIPLMLHFASVLGPGWKVILFTIESNWKTPQSVPFRRALQQNRITINYLPEDADFGSREAVSEFLTRPWFWEQLQSAYRVLLFQTDSIICANSNYTVEDFIHYDFVGAPLKSDFGSGYNGGLSIRNPKMMLSLTTSQAFSYREDSKSGRVEYSFEDQWFYTRLSERNDANLPSQETAMKFSVETIYYETPLGYHQPQRWQPDNMEQIQEYCPEVGMLMSQRF